MQDHAIAGGYEVDGDTGEGRHPRPPGPRARRRPHQGRPDDRPRRLPPGRRGAGACRCWCAAAAGVDDDELLRRTVAVLEQGARGIVYGRNVIQHPRPAALVSALMGILHRGCPPTRPASSCAPRRHDRRPADGQRRHRRRRPDGQGGRRRLRPVAGSAPTTRCARCSRTSATSTPTPWLVRPHPVGGAADDRLPRPARPGRSRRALHRGAATTCTSSCTSTRSRPASRLPGEKPFGIDLVAAAGDRGRGGASPGSFVRCSSELPFFPGAQAAIAPVAAGVARPDHRGAQRLQPLQRPRPQPSRSTGSARRSSAGRTASSTTSGCTSLHVPLRLGWLPAHVFAVLQDLVPTRPGPDGEPVPCDTIENATLLCTATTGVAADTAFPLHLTTKRIDPGQKNSWRCGARHDRRGGVLHAPSQDVARHDRRGRRAGLAGGLEMGSQSSFATSTGGIFEFGFADAILQMWAPTWPSARARWATRSAA